MTQDSTNQTTVDARVFVSYASQDATVANSIVEHLEGQGRKCWLAPRDVRAGTVYADAIVRAINEAKAVLLVLSGSAVDSAHVAREVERAASKRKPIIPFRIDAAPLNPELEYFLSNAQWIDVPKLGMSAALARLKEAVGQGSASSPQQTAPQRPTRGIGRRVVLPGAIVIALGLLIAGGVHFWGSKQGAQAPAVAAITDKSIAVLPFVDMSEKKDQEYFSDGMSEELIDMLTKVPDLRVPARTSSFYFKGKPATIAEIAKALSVLYVLEGSVRKSGTTLRITAQLIRADSGYHLWSQTYDRQIDDVFKVQDEIAAAVVTALKVSLMGGSLPQSTGTQNVAAYNLHLQAKSIFDHATKREDYEVAIEYLHQAINADPHYARPWALIAGALCAESEAGYSPPELVKEEARHAANEALRLNPSLPEAHVALARVLRQFDFDVRGAEAQALQALELDPNNSRALGSAATQAAIRGQFDTAIGYLQKGFAGDPVNPTRYYELSTILYLAGRYSEALTANRKMLDLNPAARGHYYHLEGLVSLAKGDPSGALAAIENDKDLLESCSCAVLAYDALGRKTDADAVLASLEKNPDKNAYEIACAYANRGQLNLAFKWLDRAYQRYESRLLWVKVDPLLKNVQSDPRYKAFLKKMNLPE
jgi:TolB-like protein/Flp pilus assembly protein TadD